MIRGLINGFEPGIPKLKCQHEGSYSSEGEKGKRISTVQLEILCKEQSHHSVSFGLAVSLLPFFCWKCFFGIKLCPDMVLPNRHVVRTLIHTWIAASASRARMWSQMNKVVLLPSNPISSIQ